MKLQSLLITVVLFAASNANAALLLRLGGQAVYDTDRDITWLTDAKLAATNSFGLAYFTPIGGNYASIIYDNGKMTWDGAIAWVNAMNEANYLGFHDWRLPTALNLDGTGPCIGQFCTQSEMGHLFYGELGGFTHNANYDLFRNLEAWNYWTGTGFSGTGRAWYFNTFYNYQAVIGSDQYALVVRNGDVALVPEPSVPWLLGSGLVGLIWVTSKRKG